MTKLFQEIQTAYFNGLAEEAQLNKRLEAIRATRAGQEGAMQALQLQAKHDAEAKAKEEAPAKAAADVKAAAKPVKK